MDYKNDLLTKDLLKIEVLTFWAPKIKLQFFPFVPAFMAMHVEALTNGRKDGLAWDRKEENEMKAKQPQKANWTRQGNSLCVYWICLCEPKQESRYWYKKFTLKLAQQRASMLLVGWKKKETNARTTQVIKIFHVKIQNCQILWSEDSKSLIRLLI